MGFEYRSEALGKDFNEKICSSPLSYEVLINGVQVDQKDYILSEGLDSAVF